MQNFGWWGLLLANFRCKIPDYFIAGEDISCYTTFSVESYPKYLAFINDISRLKSAYEFILTNNLPVVVLGWGSNVVFVEEQFDGVVLINRLKHIEFSANSEVNAQTGLTVNSFIRLCLNQSLSGLENCYGIPGSIAGAIKGNAGSYGTEISDKIISVKGFNPDKFEITEYLKQDLEFAYRASKFKRELKNVFLVSAKFKLDKVNENRLLEVKAIMEKNIQLREQKLPKGKNAGSFFKNPIVDSQTVSAGKLIEQAGLKEFSVGGVSVSKQHANVLENKNNATAADLIALEAIIKKRVHDQFGVELEREVVYIDRKGNAY